MIGHQQPDLSSNNTIFTSMITDRIGRHEVLLPINQTNDKI